ncbi:MAG: hypothetical protein AABX54_00565 [Nanoarchaeota archaeon]
MEQNQNYNITESNSTPRNKSLSKIEIAVLSAPFVLGTSLLFTPYDSKFVPYLAAGTIISAFMNALYFIPKDRQNRIIH